VIDDVAFPTVGVAGAPHEVMLCRRRTFDAAAMLAN